MLADKGIFSYICTDSYADNQIWSDKIRIVFRYLQLHWCISKFTAIEYWLEHVKITICVCTFQIVFEFDYRLKNRLIWLNFSWVWERKYPGQSPALCSSLLCYQIEMHKWISNINANWYLFFSSLYLFGDFFFGNQMHIIHSERTWFVVINTEHFISIARAVIQFNVNNLFTHSVKMNGTIVISFICRNIVDLLIQFCFSGMLIQNCQFISQFMILLEI